MFWMQEQLEDFYEIVKDLIKKNEFFEEINKIHKESDELFKKRTAALIVIDRLGRSDYNNIKISKLESGMDATIIAKIVQIGEERIFEKQNGKKGRVINLKISDVTGMCGLVLWDEDVNIIKKEKIQEGTIIKIINGSVKKGFNGIEINIGKWSLIEVHKNNTQTDNKNISGQILEIQPSKAFFKDNGEYGFSTLVTIKEKNQIKKLIIWNEKVKEIQNYKPGDFITFYNVENKNNNGKIEKHVNLKSFIKKN